MKNWILLLCLPAHTSHALQLLDVGVFRTLKSVWKEVLEQFRRQSRNHGVEKNIFPTLLKKAFERLSLRPELAIAGFRGSGLLPIDKSHPMKKVFAINEEEPIDSPCKALRNIVQ